MQNLNDPSARPQTEVAMLHGSGILAAESCLWNLGCGILIVESWLWNHCCGIIDVGIIAMKSELWNPGCGKIASPSSPSITSPPSSSLPLALSNGLRHLSHPSTHGNAHPMLLFVSTPPPRGSPASTLPGEEPLQPYLLPAPQPPPAGSVFRLRSGRWLCFMPAWGPLVISLDTYIAAIFYLFALLQYSIYEPGVAPNIHVRAQTCLRA